MKHIYKTIKFIFLSLLISFTSKAESSDWLIYSGNDLPFNNSKVDWVRFDNSNNLWFRCTNGLWFYQKGHWTQYLHHSTKVQFFTYINELTTSPDGTIWVGAGGLGVFDGNKWERYYYKNSEIPISIIRDLIYWRGKLWMLSYGEGLASYDGNNWSHFTRENSNIPSNNLVSFAKDSTDNLWFTTDGGITKFDGINFTEFNYVKGTFFNFGKKIAVDRSNNVWVTTDTGLAKYDGTEWRIYTKSNSGVPGDYLGAIAAEGNTIWFGVYSVGLVKYDGNKFTVFTPKNSGLISPGAGDIAIDQYGNKWISDWESSISVYREGGVIVSAQDDQMLTLGFTKVYPNPAYDEVIFEFETVPNPSVTIEISDKLGIVVKTELINNPIDSIIRHHVKMSGMAAGEYYYRISTGNRQSKGKFILLK